METLALRFLGPPRIELGGTALSMRQRKPLALLAYLAVKGQRQSRDALAELLYPGQDRERAFSDIRQCLFLLRTSIGEGRVEANIDGVELVPTGTWVDVQELGRLQEQAQGADRAGDIERCLDRLTAAAELFRGDFLSGFSLRDCPGFEDWQQGEELDLRQRRSRILERLVTLHEDRGAFRNAIGYCRSWLQLDQAEEAVHRRLMLLHALAGERAAALKQYERCREVLKKELDRYPEPETEKLRERIALGKIAASPAATQAAKPAAVGQTTMAPGPRTPTPTILLTDPPSSFAGSYESASAAVAAVLDNRSVPSIRVALHIGTSDRAAHLLALAHPGQVLISASTARALGDDVPRGASIRSLGVHRMKDLGPALEIFQLAHPGLPAEFPPLRSLDIRPNNLPSQPTTFLGRQRELAELIDAVRGEGRLVTLTGPGGSGKTRLALQGAAALVAEFENGACFVDLSTTSDPGQAPSTILASLGVADLGRDRSALAVLKRSLAGREMLLVLDNMEHLMSFAGSVGELLDGCPRLRIVVTSREPLRLAGEREIPVLPYETGGLAGKRSPEELAGEHAVQLFIERARAVRPDFVLTPEAAPAVAEICSRLDGLPLAIEMNAALLKYFSPEALRDNLRRRLDVPPRPARDVPARHRTLEATIAWSYDLLEESARRAFRRFSVFSGGCTLDAARAVCADESDPVDDILSLVDKSLLMRREGPEARFTMLQTIREFAREKLEEASEVEVVEKGRASWYLGMAEHAERELRGRDELAWSTRLAEEAENLRSSLDWFREHDHEGGLRLAAAMADFWQGCRDFRTARHWLSHFRDAFKGSARHLELAKIDLSLGWILFLTGPQPDPGPEVYECWAECIEHARAIGNKSLQAQAQVVWAWSLATPGESAAAQKDAVALARESGDRPALVNCLIQANVSGRYSGEDKATRRRHMVEAVAIAEQIGSPVLIAGSLNTMGRILSASIESWSVFDPKALAEAEPWFRRALEVAEKHGIRGYNLHMYYGDLGGLYANLGLLDRAEPLLRRCLSITAEEGWMSAHISGALVDLGRIARIRGDQRRAVRLMAAAHAFFDPGIEPDRVLMQFLEPLDKEILEEEWPVGHAMTKEEAVAYALSDSGTPASRS